MRSLNNVIAFRPSAECVLVWVLGDRRLAKDEVIKSLVNGSCSVYLDSDSAKRDAYRTEKVWEINITASEI
jgi:hypothetical protein